jgi:hypothetical protein
VDCVTFNVPSCQPDPPKAVETTYIVPRFRAEADVHGRVAGATPVAQDPDPHARRLLLCMSPLMADIVAEVCDYSSDAAALMS